MKKVKIKRSDAIELPKHTQVLANNHYFTDKRAESYTEHKEIIDQWLLTQRNDEPLKEIFGKCTFATSDWGEYTRCWIIEHLNHTFLVYSSERGTSYEMVIPDEMTWYDFSTSNEHGKIAYDFITDLTAEMRKTESNQANIAEWAKFENKMKKELDNQ